MMTPSRAAGRGRRRFLRSLLSLSMLAALAAPHPAIAQGWPARPIRIIVPFPAGGASDAAARLLAEKLAILLGQQVIVENRPGAASVVGAQAAATSPADGHTLLLGSTASLVTNRFLHKKLAYDPDDFEPVALVAVQPLVLVAHPNVAAANVRELLAQARAGDGSMTYASFGSGTLSHLALELLNIRAGTRMTHVPYKGAAEALPAVVGGHVQLYVDAITSSQPYIKSGQVKALGVASAQRSPSLPAVPTIAEQGLPGFDMTPWIGLVVRKGTPAEILEKLRAACDAVLAQPAVVEKLASLGQEMPASGTNAAALSAQIQADTPRIARLLRDARIEPQ